MEAAAVLPVFFLCMAVMLRFNTVMETAARLGSALCETGEKMAVSAYVSEYGEGNSILTDCLSAVYARSSVMGKAGDTGVIKNENFLLSSFLKDDEMIHLVMTYQVSPLAGIKIPGVFFQQRASVRGWTGRSGSEGAEGSGDEVSGSRVYVTEHGTVYHTDPNCTHIRLSIRQVRKNSLSSLRNSSGEKYHSCELCGAAAGSNVYITNEGNRYHSSLECSGLKRTVHQVSLEEVQEKRPCSKCAAGHGG